MAFPTVAQYIENAEVSLGVSLPLAWRNRLLQSNGGEFSLNDDDWTIFPVFDSSDRKKAARTASHIVLENQSAREWRGFPKSAIAIASNGSGDYLVLLPREGDEKILGEEVFLWSHETASLSLIAADIGGL